MRVLYLTYTPFPGRASTTVPTEGWFQYLPAKGLEPVLISHQARMFHEWAVDRGVPAYEVPLPFPSKRNPLPFLRSLWRLRRIARRHKIQLIHCNEQNIYPMGQYLARMLKVPIVVSVHFTMERGFCEWAFSGNRAPDRMFFVSQGNLEACRTSIEGLIPESHRRVLYNGLDLSWYRPETHLRAQFREQHLLDGSIALGVACALRPRKQLEHLFQLGERLASKNLKIVVAGGPVQGDESYAENLIGEWTRRLNGRLSMLGYLDELRGFYNGIDIFVNTSQEEACSISVMEALACGCPVLGYPSKSVDDQILPNGGEIVPQDNVADLARALQGWLAESDRLEKRRAMARQQAEDRFDIRKLSDQLWDEYTQLLGERNRVRHALALQ